MEMYAKVLADSISPNGVRNGIRLLTYELQYPRFILAELNTHHMLVGNSASSRAIPTKKLVEMIRSSPAKPVRFGENQPGMKDKGVDWNEPIVVNIGGNTVSMSAEEVWGLSANTACNFAEAMSGAMYHKQTVNRLTEPFQWMKTVITATEWENFFWLRSDEDADPTFQKLANLMKIARQESSPEYLTPGIWHTPYIHHYYEGDTFKYYYVLDDKNNHITLSTEEAKSISASCCAQVSYRVLNNTKEKALDIYGKLISGRKVHASPFAHQATPMLVPDSTTGEDIFATMNRYEGYTHVDKKGNFWSGNLKGWIQHRQLLKDNYKEG